jgi:hypothetical protein
MDKAKLMKLIAEVLPIIKDMEDEKAEPKRSEARLEKPGLESEDGPPSEAEADDVAKDKVIVMMLGGAPMSKEEEEEDEYTSSRSNKYGC